MWNELHILLLKMQSIIDLTQAFDLQLKLLIKNTECVDWLLSDLEKNGTLILYYTIAQCVRQVWCHFVFLKYLKRVKAWRIGVKNDIHDEYS